MLHNLYKSLPESMQRLSVAVFRNFQNLYYKHLIKKNYSTGSLNKQTLDLFNKQRMYGPRKRLCYAPYSSIFFSRAGYMSACYATYSEKSDRWPETSIHDAWFKGELSRIRNHIALNDLDYACSFCKPYFISHNFGSLLTKKYDAYSFGSTKYPQIMEFELSNCCNLECIMCDGNLSSSIRKNRDKQPPYKEIYNKNFVEELRPFIPHLKMAEFTGGDPFMIQIYYDIWDMIQKTNPSCGILITTNANTMTNRVENMLKTFKNLNFNISLDSLNKEHFERIRIHAGYERVINNTLRLIEYCKKNKTACNLLVCPLTINSRDIPELLNFANAHDVYIHFHNVVKPADLSLKYQNAEFLDDLIVFLEQHHPPSNGFIQRKNATSYKDLIGLLTHWKNENSHKFENHHKPLQTNHILEFLEKHLTPDSFNRTMLILSAYQQHPGYHKILQGIYAAGPEMLENILKTESQTQITKRIEDFINVTE